MVFEHSFILPPLFCIWMGVTVTITLSISLTKKHVKPVFPYISDTGTWPPESCIFSLMLFIASLLMAIIVYIRFRQVKFINENSTNTKNKTKIEKTNIICLWCGFIACFGMVMVASFQETNIFWAHVFGANGVFGVGCIYQWLQALLSYYLYPEFGSKVVNIIRIVLAFISTLSFFLFQCFGCLALVAFKGENLTLWSQNDGGFHFHIISTITEWILAISTIIFFMFFTNEFKEIQLTEPLITQK